MSSSPRGASNATGPLPRSRPTVVKQPKYEWLYLYAAVEPPTGESGALQAPRVNTGTVKMLGEKVRADIARRGDGTTDHAVLIMDQSGRHTGRELELPEDITVLLLAPYAPQMNPVERLWHVSGATSSATGRTRTTGICLTRARQPGSSSLRKSSDPFTPATSSRAERSC